MAEVFAKPQQPADILEHTHFNLPVTNYRDLLRLNVGFIVHQTAGYSREFPIQLPSVTLSPDLELTNLDGTVRVTRTPQGLLLQSRLSADTSAECVRCLAEFSQKLHVDYTDLYAFTSNSVTESGLLVPENGKIDLAPILRDEMLLAMPISPLCQPDCKGLCLVCGENLNETLCEHATQQAVADKDAPGGQ